MTKHNSNSRRKFLKTTVSAGLISPLISCSSSNMSDKVNVKPIIISTWAHGMQANKVGIEILSQGGTALDAVEKAVNTAENDPTNQTVGIGGYPDSSGVVSLDACIMKGDGTCGSVAFVQNYQNPISIARKVMEETQHIMLVGAGAERFAEEQKFKKSDLLTEATKKDYEVWLKENTKPLINIENHDTISILAIDMNGKIAGACTTSGAAWKKHGRVGDSPIIGAGLFVDEEVGAAAATGWGEAVIRTVGSAMVVEAMRQGKSPQDACVEVVARIKRKHSSIEDLQVGFIAINMNGETGAYSIHSGFNYALTTKDSHLLLDANSMK